MGWKYKEIGRTIGCFKITPVGTGEQKKDLMQIDAEWLVDGRQQQDLWDGICG